MEARKPKQGEMYKHFKGNIYEIVAIAKHSESLEELVIYRDLEGENQVYARPLEMFMSKVDKEKYPEVNQEYRFELMQADTHEEVGDRQALLLAFLDLQSATEKIQFLQVKKDELTEEFIGLAAQCLEFAETKTDFEERYYDLMRYLRTLERFEGGRVR